MFFGLNIISSIIEKSKNISPKYITCSLCYAIAYDGKRCNNRKCQNVFCGDCIAKQKLKFTDKEKKNLNAHFVKPFQAFLN